MKICHDLPRPVRKTLSRLYDRTKLDPPLEMAEEVAQIWVVNSWW